MYNKKKVVELSLYTLNSWFNCNKLKKKVLIQKAAVFVLQFLKSLIGVLNPNLPRSLIQIY